MIIRILQIQFFLIFTINLLQYKADLNKMSSIQLTLIIITMVLVYMVYNENYKTIGILTTFFIAILTLIYFKQNSLLYMPQVPGMTLSPSGNPYRFRHPKEQGLQSLDLTLKTVDNLTLKGWHILADNPERIVIYFHENAGNIGARLQYLKAISHQTNSDAILVAYRGYSDSQGAPSEEGIKYDAKAIVQYALDYGKQKKMKVFILGRSLGGAVTTYVSTCPEYENRIAGIILENTFTSISEMIDSIFPILKPFKFLQTNHWRSIDLMEKVKVPILFIMSMKDQLVPPAHMQLLRNNAKSSPYTQVYQIENGTHNSSWDLQPGIYFRKLLNFFDRATQDQGNVQKNMPKQQITEQL